MTFCLKRKVATRNHRILQQVNCHYQYFDTFVGLNNQKQSLCLRNVFGFVKFISTFATRVKVCNDSLISMCRNNVGYLTCMGILYIQRHNLQTNVYGFITQPQTNAIHSISKRNTSQLKCSKEEKIGVYFIFGWVKCVDFDLGVER